MIVHSKPQHVKKVWAVYFYKLNTVLPPDAWCERGVTVIAYTIEEAISTVKRLYPEAIFKSIDNRTPELLEYPSPCELQAHIDKLMIEREAQSNAIHKAALVGM